MKRLFPLLFIVVAICGCGESQEELAPAASEKKGNPTTSVPIVPTDVDEPHVDEPLPSRQADASEAKALKGVFDAVIAAAAKDDYRKVWDLNTEVSQSLLINDIATYLLLDHQRYKMAEKLGSQLTGLGKLQEQVATTESNVSDALKKHGTSFEQLEEIMGVPSGTEYYEITRKIERGDKLRKLIKDDSTCFEDWILARKVICPYLALATMSQGMEDAEISGDIATATATQKDKFGNEAKVLITFKQVNGQWKLHKLQPQLQ